MTDEVTFDAELRVVPVDPVAYRKSVQAMERELARARQSGEVTVALLRGPGFGRMALRDLTAAKRLLTEALELARAEDHPHRLVATLINLGDAYRYGGESARAEPCYEQAQRLAQERCPELIDYALQHLGKHRIDTGELDVAETLLMEALEIRREKGDPDLIASTEQTLEYCALRRDLADPSANR
ncbi:tetratricopeptide repeat protein [Streptomyces sp. ACA25]|uniref:tetratricopeptide repeat protein n=1 Tax=Streptomyces sp. ACA25 TaxID=3022596 RepID=UPI002307964F|nr:tetratricopeptide repeat protein [Streptomyces sp. ACA25]MDB1086371.1 tetratricopeptide repeat protein [Streptomyces sp. ACA25]